MATFFKDKNGYISSKREKIIEVTHELVHNAFLYPKIPNLEKFTKNTLLYEYVGLLAREKHVFH